MRWAEGGVTLRGLTFLWGRCVYRSHLLRHRRGGPEHPHQPQHQTHVSAGVESDGHRHRMANGHCYGMLLHLGVCVCCVDVTCAPLPLLFRVTSCCVIITSLSLRSSLPSSPASSHQTLRAELNSFGGGWCGAGVAGRVGHHPLQQHAQRAGRFGGQSEALQKRVHHRPKGLMRVANPITWRGFLFFFVLATHFKSLTLFCMPL
jgi:hypothetical protein